LPELTLADMVPCEQVAVTIGEPTAVPMAEVRLLSEVLFDLNLTVRVPLADGVYLM
jgi:hypothetical protein